MGGIAPLVRSPGPQPPADVSVPKSPAESTWGSPLRRTVTLAPRLHHAMNNSLNHKPRMPFSGRCCVKNTKLRAGGASKSANAAFFGQEQNNHEINSLDRKSRLLSCRPNLETREVRFDTTDGPGNCKPGDSGKTSPNQPNLDRSCGSTTQPAEPRGNSGRSFLYFEKSLLCESLARARFEISFQSSRNSLAFHGHIGKELDGQVLACRNNLPTLMRTIAAAQIVGRTDINVAVAHPKKIDIPHTRPRSRTLGESPYAPPELRETPFALRSTGGLPPVARRAKGGGEEGIRTLDTALDRITV